MPKDIGKETKAHLTSEYKDRESQWCRLLHIHAEHIVGEGSKFTGKATLKYFGTSVLGEGGDKGWERGDERGYGPNPIKDYIL